MCQFGIASRQLNPSFYPHHVAQKASFVGIPSLKEHFESFREFIFPASFLAPQLNSKSKPFSPVQHYYWKDGHTNNCPERDEPTRKMNPQRLRDQKDENGAISALTIPRKLVFPES